MSDAPRPSVQRNHQPAPSGSGFGTFIAVLLLLGAVVGGAYYMNQGTMDQAAVPSATTSSSSTGASSGEAGSDTKSSTEAPVQQP